MTLEGKGALEEWTPKALEENRCCCLALDRADLLQLEAYCFSPNLLQIERKSV
jgi:hypothetical protein